MPGTGPHADTARPAHAAPNTSEAGPDRERIMIEFPWTPQRHPLDPEWLIEYSQVAPCAHLARWATRP